MVVTSVGIRGYRNLVTLRQELSPGINILHGNNAQGKTNFLEAVYFCAFGRSQKTRHDSELVKWGEKTALINLEMEKGGIGYSLDVRLEAYGRKTLKAISMDKVPLNHMKDLFGKLLVVLFSPEEMRLIKAGPMERRRFMDMELCQLSPVYYNDLKEYYRVLKQRNAFLRILQKDRSQIASISIWDDQLVNLGNRIGKIRVEFVSRLSQIASEIHSGITGDNEILTMVYKRTPIDHIILEKNRQRDIIIGYTKDGIHGDDIEFLVNDRPVRSFGSQGQQRTAVLSAKLAQITLIKENTGHNPVLLLDDVFSELDGLRQRYLLSYIKDSQTIITCTGVEDFLIKGDQNCVILRVEKGEINKTLATSNVM